MEGFPDWVAVVDDAALERLVVVSPHFDDAVLSCGQLLVAHPGATVVTVMGGRPPRGMSAEATWWDRLGGFGDGDDVVGARREEDVAALAEVGAEQRWLDFPDNQYDGPGESRPPAEEIARALEACLADLNPTAVVMPLGLAHPDHVLAHEAGRAVRDRRPDDWAWLAYAEAGYQHIPGILAARLGRLFTSGLWPTPVPVLADTGLAAKQRALARYTSQLPALGDNWGYDVGVHPRIAESYWRLAPPPPGWEGLA